MSRLIVKGLPKKITEEKLRDVFGTKGTITDIQLKYTKDGVFRQFAFVGYQTDEQAQAALKHFNNTFIQTSRIKVEVCASLGSQEKPKAWSKYSEESSAYKKQHGISEKTEEEPEKSKSKQEKRKKKQDKLDEIVGGRKDDPDFVEFIEVHTKDRNLWANDAVLVPEVPTKETKDADKKKKSDLASDAAPETGVISAKSESDDFESEDEVQDSPKLAEKEISDLEYMKSLMKKPDKGENGSIKSRENASKPKKDIDLFTIKMHNIPYRTKRQEIIKYFKPIKPFSVRMPTKVHGFCYVGFKTEKDFKKAMLKDKSFINGKQIFFSDFTEKNKISKSKSNCDASTSEKVKNAKWLKQEEALKKEEDISESGRIFFRNLAYTVSEDDVQKLFEQYGPVAEVNLPIDPLTRQIKGFGTVTFVMPEHAVKAFSELDGTLFHGRLFHLIPGKSRDNLEADSNEEGLSFKQKKALKLKQSAGQSHNWNTLFLGANAVANILAKRFETSKETILDSSEGGSSAAVRLALGETQIVMEMKKFLEENDVQLSAFDTDPKKRSKTIILAKNLPADTSVSDLKPLFSKFGLIGRIVLPPSGVTAIIEFLDPSEARQAFKKLAYSKFKNLPLYLEWAPEGTFTTKTNGEAVKSEQNNNEKADKEEEAGNSSKVENLVSNETPTNTEVSSENLVEEDDDEAEHETTLFLRNLNFKTREDVIREHFKRLGAIHMIQVAMRKNPENPKEKVSLGYGFIQFKKKVTAEKALKTMQFTQIDGNQVELKRSDRTLKSDVKKPQRKPSNVSKQTGTKILVRNVPFQAKTNEVRDIFKAFGELKSVRLPKKMTPGEESHRGFGFVDFVTKSDAKKAFDTLSQSTHLYGRRLVLEWASVDDDNVDELRKRTAQSFHSYDKPSKISKKSVFEVNALGNVDDDDRES